MAVIEYGKLREYIYQAGQGKEELKARPSLPNEAQLTATFQAIEDFWVNNQTTLKASIDIAIGFTTSAALARKLVIAWLYWKFLRGNT